VRWNIALSFLFYLAGDLFLTYFVSGTGIGGVLFLFPLYAVTWFWGKKRGLVAGAIGVVLDSVVWFVAGDGVQSISRFDAATIVGLYLISVSAHGAFVFIVSKMRRREDQSRDETRRSTELFYLSEMKYRNLIEFAPLPIFIVEDGKLVFFNNLVHEKLGYSREELQGLSLKSILYKEDFEKARELYLARSEGMLLPGSSTRVVRKDGTVLWVETMGQRVAWEGRPAVLYFSSEVTERKQAEDALRASEEKYRASENKYRSLLEAAPGAICVVENEKLIFCNTHLLEMLGYSHEEMIGMEISRIIHKDDLGAARERYAARAEGKLMPKAIVRHVRKDGQVIWMETVGRRIAWEGRPAVLYFLSDVTERKVFEEQLAQAQKMEAIGRLAGGIAHDFNNMLQVILGFCSMIKSYPDDRNAILNDIGVIEDSAQRAASLTQQLLTFSRKQVVQPQVIDFGVLIQQSEKMLSRVLGEDVALTVVLGEEASRVLVDTAQMQQVIMNLALNARDAMPGGGRITISIENVTTVEAMGHEIPAGDYVRLTVDDSGHGMDSSTMDHLFEPFFTTKGLGKGTGLGLSIVFGTVKQCGGYIRVESRVGAGSTFTIHLPRVFGPTEDSKARAEEESHHGSASILVVEDETAVRNLVKKILEKGGYAVTEAKSGEEAIEICRAHDEGFDLIVTDIVLTGIRGSEVADSVRDSFPKVRVIYMSGYADKGNDPQQESLPILQKPFSATQLLAQVKRSLAGEPKRSTSST